jgi:hypothetical protein
MGPLLRIDGLDLMFPLKVEQQEKRDFLLSVLKMTNSSWDSYRVCQI